MGLVALLGNLRHLSSGSSGHALFVKVGSFTLSDDLGWPAGHGQKSLGTFWMHPNFQTDPYCRLDHCSSPTTLLNEMALKDYNILFSFIIVQIYMFAGVHQMA